MASHSLTVIWDPRSILSAVIHHRPRIVSFDGPLVVRHPTFLHSFLSSTSRSISLSFQQDGPLRTLIAAGTVIGHVFDGLGLTVAVLRPACLEQSRTAVLIYAPSFTASYSVETSSGFKRASFQSATMIKLLHSSLNQILCLLPMLHAILLCLHLTVHAENAYAKNG